jgi:hypothetical protein
MRRTVPALILTVLLLLAAATPSPAQTTQPSGGSRSSGGNYQPAPADLADAARQAYESIKPNLTNLDYPALARTLADDRRPLLPKDQQTDEAVAKLAEKIKASAKDIERTRTLLAEVEALKPKQGQAVSQTVTVRGTEVVLVKITLEGTAELAKKHNLGGPGPGHGDTTDAEGNLAVLMVKHNDTWFWNPFGW